MNKISSIINKVFKYFFTNFSKNKSRPSRYLPEAKMIDTSLFEQYKNRVLRPSNEEINQNNRSRSAKLRFAIRSKNNFKYPLDLIEKFKNYLDLESINV